MVKILPIKTVIVKIFKLVFKKEYFIKFVVIGFILTAITLIINYLFNYFLSLPLDVTPPIITTLVIFLCIFSYLYGSSFILSFIYNFCFDVSRESLQDMKIYIKKAQQTTFSVLGSTIILGLITLGGIILLIIPAIIWGVKYFFTPIISSLEGKKGKDALRESKSIVKGYFWQVLIRLVIFYLVSSFPGLIISTINPNLNFIQIFFLPITSLFYVTLFSNLKYKHQDNQNLLQNTQGI